MEGIQAESMEAEDGDVIEIVPMEEYDSHKAKLQASLSWILCKAYKDNVPPEFKEPLYEKGQGNWQIKPRLSNLLTNSDLYCQACRNMFGESATQWQGHWSIIQALSRKGIYVGSAELDVTETILMQTAPFRMKAHLALIDGLMTAFVWEVVSIERAVQAVRRFATFNASSELPSDSEDAVLFWINKVCVAVQHRLDKAKGQGQEQLLEGQTSQKVRIVSRATPRDSVSVPLMENILRDIGDGCSLAVVLSFYCPQLLKIEDICLKESVGIADSLYNIRLVKTFCDKNLPFKTFHLTYEDLLYIHDNMKANVFVLLAEIFYCFELKRIPIVTDGGFSPTEESSEGSRPATAKLATSSNLAGVHISNVTKKSFHKLRADDSLRSSSTPDIHRTSTGHASTLPHRVPLLHKRQQQMSNHLNDTDQDGHHPEVHRGVRRASSLTSQDLKSPPRQSMLAWQEHPPEGTGVPQRSQDSTTSSNLLANVSIDSEMNASFSSGSIDLGDLDNTPRIDTARDERLHDQRIDSTSRVQSDMGGDNTIHFRLQNNREHMELESVHSGASSRVSNVDEQRLGGDNLEPLLPARLKTAKEKGNNHSKEVERGDFEPKRTTPSPPKLKKISSDQNGESDLCKSDLSASSPEDRVTPLPQDQLSARDYLTSGLQDPAADSKRFEAFFIRGSVGDSEEISSHRSHGSGEDKEPKQSYTISDQFHTPEDAMAAGIPVVGESSEVIPGQGARSREGSVASSRSSGDFSDHESRKIHYDHKTREHNVNKLNTSKQDGSSNQNPFIIQKPVLLTRNPVTKLNEQDEKTLTTNFAQLKRMKENLGHVDNSGFVYMQHGEERQDNNQRSPLKEAYQKTKPEKKTSFGPLPNQTTWQNSAQSSSTNQSAGSSEAIENGDGMQPVAAELLKVRMKLEEKRRAIERKKHQQEVQQHKMRQRIGKSAFLHVVTKPKDGAEKEDEDSASKLVRRTSLEQQQPSSATAGQAVSPPVVSPPMSPHAAPARTSRAFSRDGIQQTIENVRKKWFKDDELVPQPKMAERQDSPDRVIMQRSYESPEHTSFHRSYSADHKESPPRAAAGDKSESYEEYNSSLDKLNQSLTDLQGEIMKLSLKKDKMKSVVGGVGGTSHSREEDLSSRTHSSRLDAQSESHVARARSRSPQPPSVLDVPKKPVSVPSERVESVPDNTIPVTHTQVLTHPSAMPQPTVPQPPHVIAQTYAQTLPQQSPYPQSQVHPYVLQSPSTLAGGVYTGPNQYAPVPSSGGLPPAAHYGGYVLGQAPHQPIGPLAHQQMGIPPYQHSPPQMYPTGPQGQILPAQYPQQIPPTHPAHISSPLSHPYPHTVHPNPAHSQFQHIPETHTVNSHHQNYPAPQSVMTSTPTSQHRPQQLEYKPQFGQTYGVEHPSAHDVSAGAVAPPSGTRVANQTVPQTKSEQKEYVDPQSFLNETLDRTVDRMDNMQPLHDEVSFLNDSRLPDRTREEPSFVSDMHDTSTQGNLPTQGTDTSANQDLSVGEPSQDGFFISFNSSSPRREKPKLSDHGKDKIDNENRNNVSKQALHADQNVSAITDSPAIADFVERQHDTTSKKEDISHVTETDDSTLSAGENTSGVGFVIGQDESTLAQSQEDEMLRKKEKLMQMQLKRREEVERKRQEKENELARKREEERLKQGESERRKAEEKARRETIFQQYMEKKQEKDDEEPPRVVKRSDKTRQRTRPKSMFVKAAPEPDSSEGSESFTSQEDLSATAFTISAGKTAAPKRARTSLHNRLALQSGKMRKAVSCNTLSNGGRSGTSTDGQGLAYGGLTHRRPPSPDLYRLRQQRGNVSHEGSDAGSATGAEYTGPKLFVKPSSKSNRHIIINALSYVCLAGCVNQDMKSKVLEVLAKSDAKHFVILFRDHGCQYRGLYAFDPETEEMMKLDGVGPKQITNKMIEKYFKYNSGGKSFTVVTSTKHMSVSIDAVYLHNAFWKTSKPAVKKQLI